MIMRLVFIFSLYLPTSIGLAADFEKSITDSLSVNSGLMSYEQTGLDPKSATNTSNFSLEWSHFFKKDISPFTGYRVAYDPALGRTLYQAGYAGYRYYYSGLGVPISAFRSNSRIFYNFTFRPYIESSVVLGRYLIATRAEFDAFDLSSDFYGLGFGTGFDYGIGDRYGLDFKASYEYLLGYGPLDFGASNIFVLVGMKYYL